ncbi:MAG: type II toxin-antitoxin system PemK/MazF family toxin [Rhodoferax sp.]
MKRGDVFYADLDPAQGSEIRKTRPVVIVSNNAANRAAAVVTVLPLTSNVSRIFPFEVKLFALDTGLSKDSKAMAQQVRTLDKSRLAKIAAGHVSMERMAQVDAALRLHLGL